MAEHKRSVQRTGCRLVQKHRLVKHERERACPMFQELEKERCTINMYLYTGTTDLAQIAQERTVLYEPVIVEPART